MLPHDLCARMQNAFRARHQTVGVAHSLQNLGVLSILLRAGFLSSLTRGTLSGPDPQGFVGASPAERRIWATLKYRDDRPTLSNMSLVSLPSRRMQMDVGELRRICSGRSVRTIAPLGMGEVAVVKTRNREHEWLEAREALRLGLDGEVICRAR